MAAWSKMPLDKEVSLGSGDFVLGANPAPLPQKGGGAPIQFSAHVYCGQTAVCIRIPLDTDVGLCVRDIVLDGDPAPPLLKEHSPLFSAKVRCGQTAG